MITIQASGNIAGKCGNNNSVGYTFVGMELSGNNETYKVLAQGNLTTTAANLYAAPANTTSFVKRIFLVNQTANLQAGIVLYLSGTGAAPAVGTQFTGGMSIPGNGSVVYDDDGWTAYDGNMGAQTAPAGNGLLRSISVLQAGNVNYIVPAGINALYVECVGPGGGGGGSNTAATNNSTYSGGGGAGGYAAKFINPPLAANYTVAIGTGGAGGSAAGGAAAAGSAPTTFAIPSGPTITANQGTAGTSQISGVTILQSGSGTGGAGSNGDINRTGSNGFLGGRFTTSITTGVPTGRPGAGGLSPAWGAQAPAGLDGITGAGQHANNFGGGGAGGAANGSAAANGAGGNGANGVIIVWEYS